MVCPRIASELTLEAQKFSGGPCSQTPITCFCILHRTDSPTDGDSPTDVQWLLYLQDHGCYCMLFDTSRCDPFQRCSVVPIVICQIMVVRWSGKLPLWAGFFWDEVQELSCQNDIKLMAGLYPI